MLPVTIWILTLLIINNLTYINGTNQIDQHGKHDDQNNNRIQLSSNGYNNLDNGKFQILILIISF